MVLIPTVIEKSREWERAYDIYSRLLEDRIVFVWDVIEDHLVNTVIAQLLFLEKQDPEKDITMYINSPWGSVSAGWALYDTMQYVKCDITTVCLWLAASFGAVLLAGGTKGKRFALPNSEVMIHQPSGGCQGQATDMEIVTKHIVDVKQKLNEILAKNTNQPIEKIKQDTERDNYMFAEDALKYGLVDKVLNK